MITVYFYFNHKLQHIALSASGLGMRSFSISFYPGHSFPLTDLIISTGKFRPVEYDFYEEECFECVHIPSNEDGNIVGISELGILNWINDFKKSGSKFNGIRNNCSNVIFNALNAGIHHLNYLEEVKNALEHYQRQRFFMSLPDGVFGFATEISKIIQGNNQSFRYGLDYLLDSSIQPYAGNSELMTEMNLLLGNAIALLQNDDYHTLLSNKEKIFIKNLVKSIEMLNKDKLLISPNFIVKFYQLVTTIEESITKTPESSVLYEMLAKVRNILQTAYDRFESTFKEKKGDALRCLKPD